MKAHELEAIIQLWRATSAETYTFLSGAGSHNEEGDRSYFTNVVAANNEIWAAEEDEQLQGFMAIKGSYIDRLYIHPTHQRKGVGTGMIAHAQTLSPAGLELCTHVKNVNACAFYEKHGFVAVKYGVTPPPQSEPDVEYHWRP